MRRRRPGRREHRILKADVEHILSGVLDSEWVDAGNYFTLLPTPEARRICREDFPLQWYGIFGFHGTGEFMVSDPIAFFRQHPPKIRFEEPDLRNVDPAAVYRTMTRIRAEWWLKNGLPLSEWETTWLQKHREELIDGTTKPN